MTKPEQLYCMLCRAAGRNGSCRYKCTRQSCVCSKAAEAMAPVAAAASSVSFLGVCGLQLHV